MAAPLPDPAADARREAFRVTMEGGETDQVRLRRFLRWLPTDPRCKACNAPFGMPGSLVSRSMGRRRWAKNPRFCDRCYTWLRDYGLSGVEIDGHAPVRRCPRFDDAGRTGRARRIPNADQPLLPDRERCAAPHGRPRRQVHRRRRDGHVHPGDVRPRPRGERDPGRATDPRSGREPHPRPSGCPSGLGSIPGRRSWERSGMRRRSRTSRRSATP